MIAILSKRLALLFLSLLLLNFAQAQTQDDFNNKLSDVYASAADKKKALVIAKELYNIVEKKKDLQTYANYYLLKTIFEVQAPDEALAKTCGEKATNILNGSVGLNTPADTTASPFNQWYYSIYPGLFKNSDPQIARKALAFIKKYPEFQTFESYYYIAFSFERRGDFNAARENYEKALSIDTVPGDNYRTYLFYTNFLSKSGDYLKAEEYIRKIEQLSLTGNEMFRDSYKSELLGAKVVYYLNIGDYKSYIEASEQNNAHSSALWHKNNTNPCDPYPGIRFTTAAHGKEMLKDYDAAERLWKSRDSVNYIWVNCHNKTYPNNQYFPISMYAVYLIKRGKASKLPKPVSFYINETETHYNSYSQFADISVNFMRATQLGFLGSNRYPELFQPLISQVKNNRNFRESTTPLANYAYFSMRDRKTGEARKTYADLFTVNIDWMNDIIFSFGERAFATYYNSKLKEGYDNFHSFVKLAKEKDPAFFAELSQQAYNNLLFTKSISLKGTQRRKEAFLNANDSTIDRLYEQWIDKKQQLLRQYLKADNPTGPDTANRATQEYLKQLQNEVSSMENELTLKAKDFKKYLKLPAPDWKQVRDQLKEGEAAIEIIRFQWRDQLYYSDTVYYAAYIITKNSEHPDVLYLPAGAADLDNKYYKAYRNYVRLKMEDKESYKHYWKPIAEKLPGIRKLYFSPDGIYHLINISTLKNPQTNQYLVDELEIQYTVTGSDINKDHPATENKTAVLIGRPSYRVNEAPGSAPKATTRSYVLNFTDKTIADLPGTEEEVLAIKKELEKNKYKVTSLLKDQATEDKLYQLHSPGILHIATHGYWSPAGESATEGYRVFNAMANSGLLLSGVINYYSSGTFPDTYDGVLTAYEAQNLDLENTSLVILSACETSLGAMDAGEGIYGLQRAFRAAGAKTVITSLWKVDDAATRDFMSAFHEHHAKSNDRLAAFMAAQKAMKEKYRDPFYWGAFVMVGE